MGTIHELGQNLRARRTEMGLSQAQVAALSGLSRQTINQVESGTVPDLGINKAERLASILGLALRVDAGRPPSAAPRRMAPLARAAVTSGVSYRTPLAAVQLGKILATGQVPDKYAPHLYTLLDDAPVSLLAAVAEQIDNETNIGRDSVWKNCRSLARQLKSRRDIWR